MVKVEFKRLTPRKARTVSSKSFRTAAGTTVTIRRIDADSDSFGDDLRHVFDKNVQKARRENKKLTRGRQAKG